MRLAAQRIAPGEPATPGQVVRSMLAMQGQDFPGARWSIGLRGHGLTDDEVGAAFDAGDIVRSWPMRGTLHVVAAEDIGWMLALLAPRVIAATATRRAQLGITEDDLRRARDAVVAALEGGRALEREALLSAISAGGTVIDGQRGYHLLGHLAQTGVLVLGPISGKQQTYVLLAEWVRNPRRLMRDEALGELADRYFRSHGPATERDLARWSGLPLGDVRRGLALCETVSPGSSSAGSPTTWPRRCWTQSRLLRLRRRSRMFDCFPGSTSTCSAMGIGAPPWPRSTPRPWFPATTGCSCRRS